MNFIMPNEDRENIKKEVKVRYPLANRFKLGTLINVPEDKLHGFSGELWYKDQPYKTEFLMSKYSYPIFMEKLLKEFDILYTSIVESAKIELKTILSTLI